MRAPELTQTKDMDIGGALGLGKSRASATIWLEKNRFIPGEEVKIHIDMNNKVCKKPLKWFKTYIRRTITFYSGKVE